MADFLEENHAPFSIRYRTSVARQYRRCWRSIRYDEKAHGTMATGKFILVNLEKDIEKLESLLDEYRLIEEEVTERWGTEKPLFAKDFQETIRERKKRIMENLSSLYITRERFAEDEPEQN